jgi:hypothetical protein
LQFLEQFLTLLPMAVEAENWKHHLQQFKNMVNMMLTKNGVQELLTKKRKLLVRVYDKDRNHW